MSIQDPPRGFINVLRKMGPGMILAGSIVGSGELIATTRTGAEAGFSFLWIILLGCLIKVFTQIEFARYSISSGRTTLRAFLDVPGGAVIFALWFIMFVIGIGQLGGIVGGVGQALAISVPLTEKGREYNEAMAGQMAKIVELQQAGRDGENLPAAEASSRREGINAEIRDLKERLKPKDAIIWCILIGVLTAIILYIGNFGFIEAFCVVMVVLFTFITIGNAVALQTQDAWAMTLAGWRADGWLMPDGTDKWGALTTALAAFGIIGVGASEIVAYPYWCLEKGYGKWTGPRDASTRWAERAQGWIRVMHYDAWGSMVLYTISTIAFYILGASVLHRIGLVPEKSEMVRTLSVMYEPVFGKGGQLIFLFGAFAVLFSTFFVANAQKARLFADVFVILCKLDDSRRVPLVRFFSALLPLMCVVVFVFYQQPVVLVLISGVIQSLLLLPLGIAALYFRYFKTDPRLRPGPFWDVLLWLSVICFAVIGLYLAMTKILGYVGG